MMLGPYSLNTIVTGDARELAQAIPDESVDLVLTDPPFGIGFDYSNGYKDNPETYLDLIRWIVSESNRVIRPGGLCFVFQAQPQLRLTWPLFPEISRLFSACKSWVQMRPTPVQFAYDPVVFWQKDGEYLKEKKGRDWHVAKPAHLDKSSMNYVDFHDCPRPLDTITYMVDSFCPPAGLVADFFMGSGTTAVAAKITGRQYIGFEQDSHTAELARARVANTQPPLFVVQHEQLELT